jgi:uncharacterized protein (TIGR03083 family)
MSAATTEPDHPDYARAYREVRQRVVDLVRAAPPGSVEELVPGTPEWRARDVLAHLAGICDDIVSGNLAGVGGAGTDDWTAAQVEKRRGWDVDAVIADWETHAAAVEPLFDAFPPGSLGQMLADAATHERDLRGAFDVPGARDSDAVVIGFAWGTDRLGTRLHAEGAGTLEIETELERLTLGAGAPVSTLRAPRFEITRAMTGRRSRAQMHAFDWDGPFDPEGLLLFSFFTPAARDILE